MKILFVTLYHFFANNSGMMRNRALVNGLIENGHAIDVLTVGQNRLQETVSYDSNGVHEFYYAGNNSLYDSITNQKNRQRNKIKVFLEKVLRKLYHRFYPYDYTMHIAKKISINSIGDREYDLIISSSNPLSSHKAVECLIKQGLVYKKWVQYWGDPLSCNISNTTLLPDFILRKLERKLFSSSDKVVFVSPLTLEYEGKHHKSWSNRMAWLPVPSENHNVYNGSKYIAYFGDYVSKTRNIMPFYEAAKELDFPTIIAGTSDIKLSNTANVKVYERCDVSKFMEETKLLVVILNRKGNQIPGKIYHYAGTNIRILVICDGDYSSSIQTYFKQYKERFSFCDNSKDEIKAAITRIMMETVPVKPIFDFSSKNIAKQIVNLAQAD